MHNIPYTGDIDDTSDITHKDHTWIIDDRNHI